VYIGFGSEGNFSFAWGNMWSFFASFLASSCLGARAFCRALLASCWFFMIREAMSSAERTAVGRTLTPGTRLIIRPKVISNSESSDESPGAALIAV